ncbi:nitroreductase [Variovorax sp. PCZ-1]|uniref:nitroreductase n=1 Tax=Variovorax sp. PCZ-1 TaxID=2835533 RepID=UPI001BCEDCE2|nr:nitroreductase [Variovorax sp. PCZ-1]MBS7807325.1 nitroreductase [Variovorax sp. PCZ-1]
MKINEQLASPQVSTKIKDPSSVDQAILSRYSNRAFLPKEVEREKIEHILQIAARSPSGVNTQPWKVYVLQGEKRAQVSQAVCAAHDAIVANPELAKEYVEEYDYYPATWTSPYIERRRECGFGLYGVLGIGKGDKAGMHAQHQRNYKFFDAPVGLMFTIDKVMGRGSLLDYGMFVQSVMIAARAQGLHTCPQAAWNSYAKVIFPIIGAADNEMLVCGMSLGYADESALVNTFATTRVDAKDFTTWL